jgi:hypothetical protein
MNVMEMALERGASERAYLPQAAGIDKDSSLTVVFLVKQVNQFPGGTAVKIPLGVHVQVTVDFLEFYPEMVVHTFPSRRFLDSSRP